MNKQMNLAQKSCLQKCMTYYFGTKGVITTTISAHWIKPNIITHYNYDRLNNHICYICILNKVNLLLLVLSHEFRNC